MKLSRAGTLLVVLVACSMTVHSQTWHALLNQPSFGASIPLLLTDGTVLEVMERIRVRD